MNLVEYYTTDLEDEIISFRDKLGLSVRWMQSIRVFYVSIDNENNVSDESCARKLGINIETYRGLLIKHGGTPGENVNFDKREDAQKARDAIAFYVWIERRLKNESN